jgi:hypothetical protein
VTTTPDPVRCSICDRVPGTPLPEKPELCGPCAERLSRKVLADVDLDPDGGFFDAS